MNNCCHKGDKTACKVLSVAECQHPGCSFYMTEGERIASQSTCDERLRSLPADQQGYIAGKYYNCRKPWNRPRSQTF